MKSTFEAKKQVCVDLATEKARKYGKSSWPFEHDGVGYIVEAVLANGKVRVRTKKA